MRAFPIMIAALGLCALTGCTASPERLDGQATPAGVRSPTVSAVPSVARTASSPSPGTAGAASTVPAGTSAPTSGGSTPASIIRRTDWANVNLHSVGFMDLGDLRFRDGEATTETNHCTLLPGGARPAYGEYLAEEPADSPVTEDALVLIECGLDDRLQALLPVKLGFDQKTRYAAGFIQGDRIRFLSYRLDGESIVTTVRTTAGNTETRRYQFAGGTTWERA
jgi:hypothetical protein